jgi:hypothetical protein
MNQNSNKFRGKSWIRIVTNSEVSHESELIHDLPLSLLLFWFKTYLWVCYYSDSWLTSEFFTILIHDLPLSLLLFWFMTYLWVCYYSDSWLTSEFVTILIHDLPLSLLLFWFMTYLWVNSNKLRGKSWIRILANSEVSHEWE